MSDVEFRLLELMYCYVYILFKESVRLGLLGN